MGTSATVVNIDEILALIPDVLPTDRRYVVAIAGPPASGKTTLAAALTDRLGDAAGALGMDAYHYDNVVLERRGLLERKGAVETFDAAAFGRGLRAVRDAAGQSISVPVFDRDLELSRNCAAVIAPQAQVIITEGNYLLVRHEPWRSLRDLFDLTVWIDAPRELLRSRLMDRWRAQGHEEPEVLRRTEGNDLPNADYTVTNSVAAHVIVGHG